MKKFHYLIILTINTAFGQTIENPDFEVSALDNQINVWEFRPANGTAIAFDSTESSSGAYSLSIGGTTKGWFVQTVIVEKKFARPTRLRFHASVKSRLNKGYAELIARTFNHKGSVYFHAMNTERISGNHDWARYYLDVIVDSSTQKLRVGGFLKGDGAVYFDDFGVEVLENGERKPTTEALTFTREYLRVIGRRALFKDSVDFGRLSSDVHQLTHGQQTIRDCYPILTYALGRLGDNHSFFMSYEEVQDLNSDDDPDIVYADWKLINEKIGYVSIPTFVNDNADLKRLFADRIQSALKSLDSVKLKGWVVDLRENQGGNCWPMIAGVGPLLGSGVYGYFVDRNGESNTWSYYEGASWEGQEEQCKVSVLQHLQNVSVPIAVLVSGQTASSGEVVAVSFLDLPQVKLFGQPTYGLTTGNDDVTLKDGSVIFITEVVFASRNKTRLGGKIVPDFLIEEKSKDKDLVLERALEWITNPGE